MRFMFVLAGAASVWGACNQCPFPTLNITGFLPCLKPVIGEDCCATGRPLVNNPCIKIWLTNPLLAPYVKIIDKARVACKVDQLAPCDTAVARACPTECGLPTTLSSTTTLAGAVGVSASATAGSAAVTAAGASSAGSGSASVRVTASAPISACGSNENYTTCGSSSCFENTCVNGTVVIPGPICTTDCRQGCKCANGYARNASGACISEETCKASAPKTPCQARAAFEKAACAGRVGCDTAGAKCLEDGSFAPKQCRGSTGYCWCVDKDGKEIEGTRKGPTEEQANCAAVSKSCNCPPLECAPGWTKKLILGTEGNCCKGNYQCVEEPVVEAVAFEPVVQAAPNVTVSGKAGKRGKNAKNGKKAKASRRI